MRRQFHWDKKYLYWGVTAFLVIAAAIVFYLALSYLSVLGAGIKRLFGILGPFVWGLVLSYLLNPLTRGIERHLFQPLAKRLYKGKRAAKAEGFARGMAVLASEIVMLAVIVALFYLILPQLYSSIVMIVDNSPIYIANLTKWVEQTLQDFPELETYISDALQSINTNVMDWARTTLLPGLGSMVSNLTAGLAYVVKGVYNLIIGIIVSVYILSNMERFIAGVRRLTYSLFGIETAEKIRDGLAFTDKTFMGFINGKLLDSAIIGLICYIVCAILNMPYALLVSVIVGVTNIIPFFGPFIGAVPSALIILMVDPMKTLIFVIFIIVLQQIDGNLIGPKILGSSIGINGFWVMFSIILGAGLFGFWGMLLGVPVFVLIYTLIDGAVVKKLKKSDLPWETAEYVDLESIDPVTREIIKKPEAEE
ncbi:MAG: AI-2E family transporter [Oscillospiraceae bacterium]|jgi:Predicted permease|nr:AI-2E family transporter [Oscillospiraceae bacterium]